MRTALSCSGIFSWSILAATYQTIAQSDVGLRIRDFAGESLVNTIQRRVPDRTIPLVIDNNGFTYSLNLTLGTPGQKQTLQITFDNGLTWINAANASYCNSHTCTSTYNMTQSSSSNVIPGVFQVTYQDGSNMTGAWINDTMGLGAGSAGFSISGFPFGLAYQTTLAAGILGLGNGSIPDNDAQAQSLPVFLYQHGFIDCICYSLWLNDATASQGRLIFGGVDTSKFRGNLVTLPLTIDSFPTISLASVQTSSENVDTQIVNTPLEVLPNPGSTLIMLPSNVTDLIYQQVGVVNDTSSGSFLINCQAKNSSVSVDFTFAISNKTSTTISIPLKELVLDPANDTYCLFGITPSYGVNILGVTFFRNAYIVYDFTHGTVSVAPANFYSTNDNVTAIGEKGVDGSVDSGTGPLSSSTSATSTNFLTSSTSTPSISPTATPHHSLTTADKAGIGVGIPFGVTITIAAVGVFILQRRRRQRKAKAVAAAEAVRHEKPELGADDVKPELHELKTDKHLRHEMDAALSSVAAAAGTDQHELRTDDERSRHELPSAQEARPELDSHPYSSPVVRHELSSDLRD